MAKSTTEVDEGTNGQGPAEAITPKQLALLLQTNARTVRKFLRTQYGKVGQGNRWGVDSDELPKFVEAWGEWREKVDARGKEQAEAEDPAIDDVDTDEMEVN